MLVDVDCDYSNVEIMLYSPTRLENPLPDEFLQTEGSFFMGRTGEYSFGLAWVDRLSMVQLGKTEGDLRDYFESAENLKGAVDDLIFIAANKKYMNKGRKKLLSNLARARFERWGI
ncbi:MAG: hypothetical protein EOM64_10940 [Erysipelotrichia bacterium]|nr:hypothetical protein [Erysipelotrichia bacterium]